MLPWFEIDDIDAAIARAEVMKAEVVLPRRRNPPTGDGGPNHWEIWLRDLDGYMVVLASRDLLRAVDHSVRANADRYKNSESL